MAPAFLLSLLKQQWSAMGERFNSKHSHAWLVWEPGAWTAPAATTETVEISSRALDSLAQGDALSFGLIIAEGKQPVLRIGRNAGNDIVINDATVSRQHATLTLAPSKEWLFEPIANAKAATRIGAADARPGVAVPLRSKDQIRLGDVTLTFYELPDFVERLREMPSRAGR
jgi:pSer/pThr/pTyr-binding forkhead associated (FHA) protein